MEYINEQWYQILKDNGADNFEALWSLNQGDWVEEPNYRRGGWSGVCKATLTLPDGHNKSVYIKRQENHFYKSWQDCFTNKLTFEREYQNVMHFKQSDIPTLDVLYFGRHVVNGEHRCVLVSSELEGYQPINEVLTRHLSLAQRKQVFESVASTIRAIHKKSYQHSNLYPKHIFVKLNNDVPVESCLIDLEKTRRRLLAMNALVKDLDILNRHMPEVNKTERMRFFLAYRQEKKLSQKSKKILRKILAKRS